VIVLYVRVRAVHEVRFWADRDSLPLSIHLSAEFAVIRVIGSQFAVLICQFSSYAQRHSHHGMCFLNLSFSRHRVETGDRGLRGWTWSCDDSWYCISTLLGQIQRSNPSMPRPEVSDPSLAGQLRPKAHCHNHLPLIIRRRKLPRLQAFSPLARGYIPGSGTAGLSATSSSPTCITDLAATFSESAVCPQRQPGRSRPRHREAFSPLVKSVQYAPCSGELG
jgi:hypothetical protein